jgi:hypothetical protein
MFSSAQQPVKFNTEHQGVAVGADTSPWATGMIQEAGFVALFESTVPTFGRVATPWYRNALPKKSRRVISHKVS